MNVRISKTSGNRNLVSGFLRLYIFSLLTAVFACTTLHAQTVAYVTNSSSNTVSVIDVANNAGTATIGTGNAPVGVVFTPDGTRAYVTNFLGGTVSVIATASNTVLANIQIGGFPAIPAVTPDGNTLYVPTFNSVVVVNTATNSVIATIVGGNAPYAAAITPDGTRAYVLGLNTVSVIDTASNTIVQSIAVDSFPFLELPFPVIAITPGGGTVYVGGQQPNSDVQAISTASNTVVATIPLPPSGGLGVTPDGSRIYVSDLFGNVVRIIDAATNTVEPSSIAVGGFPNGVGVTPDGASVYTVNGNGNTVSVVSTATNTLVATIPVGLGPTAVAFTNLNAPFASFPAPTPSNIGNPNRIALSGSLSLGANSQGLDFAHQPMTLTVGGFSLLFPAGTVTQVGNSSQQHFTFSGTLNGLSVAFNLIGNSPNFTYSFTIQGKNVATQVGPNPVTVALAIGNNSGSSTTNF